MYTVDYFIRKFEAIPEKMWLVEDQGEDQNGPHCAIGWCKNSNGKYGSANATAGTLSYSEEAYFLSKLMSTLNIPALRRIDNGWNVAYLNNGSIKEYQQSTPKQRILAALYDIQKQQQPVYEDITKELVKDINVGDTADQPIKQLS